MAYDTVTLFLYPPRWQKHSSVPDPTAMHSSGQPVRIISSVRSENDDAPALPFDDVRRWFEAKGLKLVVDGNWRVYQSPLIATHFEPEPEIEVGWNEEAGEVADVDCRFQLNRETPMRLERWEAFMRELCEAFQLRIAISDTEYVGPEEFLSVVRRDEHWQDFAKGYGWKQT